MTLVDTVAMILRVWALHNQSKFILGALFTLYAIEVIAELGVCVLYSTRKQPVGMYNMASCSAHYITPLSIPYSDYHAGG